MALYNAAIDQTFVLHDTEVAVLFAVLFASARAQKHGAHYADYKGLEKGEFVALQPLSPFSFRPPLDISRACAPAKFILEYWKLLIREVGLGQLAPGS